MSDILYTYRHHLQFIHDMTRQPRGTYIAGLVIASIVTSRTEIKGGSIPQRIRISSTPISIGELWLACLDLLFAETKGVTSMDATMQDSAQELISGVCGYFTTRDRVTSGGALKTTAAKRADRQNHIELAVVSMLALHIYESSNAKMQGDLVYMYLEYATTLQFPARSVNASRRPVVDAIVLDCLNPAHTASEVSGVEDVCLPGRGALAQAMPRFWELVLRHIDAVHVPEENDLPTVGNAESVRAKAARMLSDNHVVSETIREFAASTLVARTTLDIVTYDIPVVEDAEDSKDMQALDCVLLDADAFHASKTMVSRIDY